MKKLALAGLFAGGVALACPSPEQVKESFSQFFMIKDLKVVAVKPDQYVKGLCDVVVEFNGQKLIFYTDESGKYVLLGSRGLVQIVDLQTRKSITEKQLEEVNRLSASQVHELDKYVAFTYGNKGKVVYLFTDPECPFCQRIEPTLKKLADEGKIQVKVIFMPLPFHRHAKEKAVATICQNIGWEGLKADYWTPDKVAKLKEWQCKKGEEIVSRSMEAARKFGVTGTPTIITEDGKKIGGALPEPILKEKLGIE